MIRKLNKTEFHQAVAVALEVYLQCGQDDFDDKGLEAFKSFIFNDERMNELRIYGAFEENRLVGIMGTKIRASTFLYFSSTRTSIEKESVNNFSITHNMIVRQMK